MYKCCRMHIRTILIFTIREISTSYLLSFFCISFLNYNFIKGFIIFFNLVVIFTLRLLDLLFFCNILIRLLNGWSLLEHSLLKHILLILLNLSNCFWSRINITIFYKFVIFRFSFGNIFLGLILWFSKLWCKFGICFCYFRCSLYLISYFLLGYLVLFFFNCLLIFSILINIKAKKFIKILFIFTYLRSKKMCALFPNEQFNSHYYFFLILFFQILIFYINF